MQREVRSVNIRFGCSGLAAARHFGAYNYDHLAYMASYVGAYHRMRNPLKSPHFDNSSMASRFPHWMISAKNRAAVLRGIQMPREKKDTSGR